VVSSCINGSAHEFEIGYISPIHPSAVFQNNGMVSDLLFELQIANLTFPSPTHMRASRKFTHESNYTQDLLIFLKCI
jgi:hypothetical protein